jgi:hypothetical protein
MFEYFDSVLLRLHFMQLLFCRKMNMRFLSSSFMFTLCLSLWASTSHAQSFYKWIDAQGSTHYTLTPPPKSAQNMGQVKTHDGPPPPPVLPVPLDVQNNLAPSQQESPLLPNLATMNPVELPTAPQTATVTPHAVPPVNKSPNKTYIPLPPPQAGAQANYY